MKDLLTGEQMLFTELQNFAAFKSYRILKFGKLVGSLIKKDAKIEFSERHSPKVAACSPGRYWTYFKA